MNDIVKIIATLELLEVRRNWLGQRKACFDLRRFEGTTVIAGE